MKNFLLIFLASFALISCVTIGDIVASTSSPLKQILENQDGTFTLVFKYLPSMGTVARNQNQISELKKLSLEKGFIAYQVLAYSAEWVSETDIFKSVGAALARGGQGYTDAVAAQKGGVVVHVNDTPTDTSRTSLLIQYKIKGYKTIPAPEITSSSKGYLVAGQLRKDLKDGFYYAVGQTNLFAQSVDGSKWVPVSSVEVKVAIQVLDGSVERVKTLQPGSVWGDLIGGIAVIDMNQVSSWDEAQYKVKN